jgi:hypothetical protein
VQELVWACVADEIQTRLQKLLLAGVHRASLARGRG